MTVQTPSQLSSPPTDPPASPTPTKLINLSTDLHPVTGLPLNPDPRPGPYFCTWPPASTKEHFRDISFLGPITLHRFFIVLWLGGLSYGMYRLSLWLWPDADDYRLWWSLVGLGLLIPFPATFAYILGALLFRYDTKLDKAQSIAYPVVFRIVSRGTNARCLLATIRKVQVEMKRNPLFPYLIEVVTDADVFEAPDELDVVQLKVPLSYTTPNGTLFKARALHYACENTVVPGHAWVVHLDEESQPASSAIKGIAKWIKRREESGRVKVIGQGMLLYHRAWETNPFLSLADMRRTGEDLGYFHLEHRLGYPLFGLHGSFVVCRQDMEASVGFDLGVKGSITEDAWWVLVAVQQGFRTSWIDGYIEEQACEDAKDFLKQRRRWYVGLIKVGRYCPVKFRYRFFLVYNTLSWIIVPIVVPLQIAYVVISIVERRQIHLAIHFLTNLILGVAILSYMGGLIVNLREHRMAWWKWPFWMIACLLCIPFLYVLEVSAVIATLFSPFSQTANGFHVVKKDGKDGTADLDSGDEVVDSTDVDEAAEESPDDSADVESGEGGIELDSDMSEGRSR